VEEVNFDKARKIRVVRFVDTHSHGDTVGETGHDPSLLGEARSVLLDLLDLIKSEDPQHYSAMVSLVTEPAEDADSE
jgi:hypothetical protein